MSRRKRKFTEFVFTLISLALGTRAHAFSMPVYQDVFPASGPLPIFEHGQNKQEIRYPRFILNVVDNKASIERNLDMMERKNLQRGSTTHQGWSSDYWPYYKGSAAYRYKDPHMVAASGRDFMSYYNAYQLVGSQELVQDDKFYRLSPAEKYDLLVGDLDFTLTRSLWSTGKYFYEKEGEVAPWIGLCNGWAAASIYYERPSKAVTVTGALGHQIEFNPDDIKALGALLWAEGDFDYGFGGLRCRDRLDSQDDVNTVVFENGRNYGCFDINPAVWHIAVVNQIGVSKRSLLTDASKNYQVWNYPLVAYEYRYFDVLTNKQYKNLAEAVRDIDEYTHDPFRKFRAPGVKKVVGVIMKATYRNLSHVGGLSYDNSNFDRSYGQSYKYDLELTHDLKIIGGEWHRARHPDFVWVPYKGEVAQSRNDHLLRERWDGYSSVPREYTKYAKNSSRKLQPLEKIVSTLFNLSSQ